ncbi:hypothetical protein A3A76_05795 [Candidatus Woesebacteria bacterium RIFCSPLOWO2_01_FULL_39_23]|uniref:CarD-like/TRCF RNAP-interacting domain-containing protein n=1 Tax=Candidatus Woesebacteria bacterium RIFCSPHIGHO2_01_FULL_40_22 TaxID=1802499 RepID=A0A1F7YHY7_9BACT|nr:MAG: hypothetical protein A2141_02490 [Candidatus Woesebacteria bacterium RBG_16_40_11]OGM26913.1 MAG: hypothetical protein A2628_05735 [Candidatus Woesebacteria bacterium RIFCSPHIGHO2_01_FULL_40_22]OGM63188.1 MAG: hypothetical protein A3A76_05795 [Candidatus Woesebacteria bacterium RIFCSPLOWO2_01_FULL_39_23]
MNDLHRSKFAKSRQSESGSYTSSHYYQRSQRIHVNGISGELKKGNKLIERGKVYKVIKISLIKTDGKVEKIVHYCPYFVNSLNKSLLYSIPEKSIAPEDIRKPLSKKELELVLSSLSEKMDAYPVFDIIKAKDDINLNNIQETANVLRQCLKEKKAAGENYTKVKRDFLDDVIEMMVEEVALVFNISLEKAEEKIRSLVNI